MKIYYITLNSSDEASQVSQALLEKQLAVCTNYFPISCMYRWEGEIKQGGEVALIVKTQAGMREKIESVIAEHIKYTNFIAELGVESVNQAFSTWLQTEM
jgi:periplasmic divalent cation tolerance protein